MNLISQHPAELILDVGNDLFDDVVDVFILECAGNILEGEVKGDRFIARFDLFARIDIEDADVYKEGTAFFADFGFKVACGDTRFYNDGDITGNARELRDVFELWNLFSTLDERCDFHFENVSFRAEAEAVLNGRMDGSHEADDFPFIADGAALSRMEENFLRRSIGEAFHLELSMTSSRAPLMS